MTDARFSAFALSLMFCLLSVVVPAAASAQENPGLQMKTIHVYIDCGEGMQSGDIMETAANVLPREIERILPSAPEGTRILVEAFCEKEGQPFLESRFTYRIGQRQKADYTQLRDFERPSMWAAKESDINLVIGRDAWPADSKNANTSAIILTNSVNSPTDKDLEGINNAAKAIGSSVRIVKMPRRGEYKTEALKTHLAGLLGEALAQSIAPVLPPPQKKLQAPPSAPLPVAAFDASPAEGVAPLAVVFTNRSKNAAKCVWDFGDGQKSDAETPRHTYKTAGVFDVNLVAISADGKQDTSQLLRIKVAGQPQQPPPTAAFDAAPTEGDAPLTVVFTSKSQNTVKYLWDFGDGGKSDIESPRHTFKTAGNFDVHLVATSADGKQDTSKPRSISVRKVEGPKPPVSAFDATPMEGEAPLTVVFANKSKNADKCLWDFGDGAKSAEDNPTHIYTAAGVYDVDLTASSADARQDTSKPLRITVRAAPPTLEIKADCLEGDAPLKVAFTSMLENAVSIQWDFGDKAGSSEERNPKYTYKDFGEYIVKATVSGAPGVAAVSKTLKIIVSKAKAVEPIPAPIPTPQPIQPAPSSLVVRAAFDASPSQGDAPLKVKFTNKSENADSFKWDFGDGSKPSTERSPVHEFKAARSYTVTLATTMKDGDSDKKSATIIVKEAGGSGILPLIVILLLIGGGVAAWFFWPRRKALITFTKGAESNTEELVVGRPLSLSNRFDCSRNIALRMVYDKEEDILKVQFHSYGDAMELRDADNSPVTVPAGAWTDPRRMGEFSIPNTDESVKMQDNND